jgi:hypothetical protein
MFEILICLAVQTDVASVREIAQQAYERLAALPQATPHPAQNPRYGIKVPATTDHF